MKTNPGVLFVLGLVVFPCGPVGAQRPRSESVEQHRQTISEEETNGTEQQLRQRAFYIADAMAGTREIENELEAAHIRADFATLLCVYGEREKGAEVIKNSIREATRKLLLGDIVRGNEVSTEPLELPVRLSQLMDDCESSSQFSIAEEIAGIGLERENKRFTLEKEDDIVPDELWGSTPSPRRQLAADILARAAYQKAFERNPTEAEKLLSRSLDFCVTPSVAAVLLELAGKGAPQAAARLFFKAAEEVKRRPSGSELASISSVIFMHLRIRASARETSPNTGAETDPYLQAYVDSVLGLVRHVSSNLAGRSADTVRMVKQSLSYPVIVEPLVRREIEEWIAAMTRNLSPEGQAAVVRSPFHAEPPEQKVAKLEEIAAKSVDAKERDAAHASIASTHIASGKFDEAREVISKIADPALQRAMLDDVTYRQTSFSLAKKAEARPLMEEIGKVARIPTRIKLYVRVAKASAEKDKVLAMEALQEAAVLAGKLEPSAMQSHFLLAIADVYADFDAVRAFEMLHESIKSINKHREQPASRWGPVWVATTAVDYDNDWRFPRRLYENPEDYRKPYDFSFVRKLAWIDFDGVMLAAASLQDKLLQASVKYELCAGILEKGNPKKKRPSGPPPL